MKLLFALAVLCIFSAPAVLAAAKPKPAPAPTAAPATEPAAPRERKPGFWERAWGSTKKGAGRVWGTTKKVGEKTADVAASPFRRGDSKKNDPESGWRRLSMSMTLDPVAVKLPETRAIRVTVTVVNTGKQPTQLDFPTTQRIEVLLKSEGGKVLSKWSEDQKLDAEQGFLVINPDERLEYTATVSTRDMSPGQTYLVEAFFPSFDQLRSSRTIVPTQ
jgi:hypothetical protein